MKESRFGKYDNPGKENLSISEIINTNNSITHPECRVGVEKHGDIFQLGWYRPNGEFAPINSYSSKAFAESDLADLEEAIEDAQREEEGGESDY